MGYPLEKFVEQDIKDEFKCPICKDALQDPVVVEPCEHAMCKKCCDEWKKRSKTCPVDRRLIEAIKKPQRLFLSLLNDQKMYCRFKGEEEEIGCTRILPLGDMSHHEERCDYNPDNERECDGGCGAIISRVKHRNHNCVIYLKDKLQVQVDKMNALKNTRNSMRKEIKDLKDKLARYEQRKELEVIINAMIAQNQKSQLATADRHSLEMQIEATLNEQFTQEDKYGPNTSWRVGLMDPKCKSNLLNGQEPPCPCHRGARERSSKHYGGNCSGEGDFEVLATHNFTTEKGKYRVRIAHYVPITHIS